MSRQALTVMIATGFVRALLAHRIVNRRSLAGEVGVTSQGLINRVAAKQRGARSVFVRFGRLCDCERPRVCGQVVLDSGSHDIAEALYGCPETFEYPGECLTQSFGVGDKDCSLTCLRGQVAIACSERFGERIAKIDSCRNGLIVRKRMKMRRSG